jgi:hypothetical protein
MLRPGWLWTSLSCMSYWLLCSMEHIHSPPGVVEELPMGESCFDFVIALLFLLHEGTILVKDSM